MFLKEEKQNGVLHIVFRLNQALANTLTLWVPNKSKEVQEVQSERDFMPARASPFGFAVPYSFSISPTCGFAFGDVFWV